MKGGVFRGIIAATAMLFARFRWNQTRTNHYPDPLLRDPYFRSRSRASTKRSRQGKPRLRYPDCEPGTIAFHDLLVRKYGRRVADEIGRRHQNRDLNAIPRF